MASTQWLVLAGFWMTFVAAVVAVGSLIVSYLLLRSAVDPCVIVYATPDDRRPSIILLVIENIGKTMAKDITFELSRPLPTRAFGFLPEPPPAREMSEGPLISGVPALGPGAKRIITWGQFGGLFKALGDDVVEVTARYQSDLWGPFLRRKHETTSPLEVTSLFGTDASTRPDKRIADQLEKIATTLEEVSGGFKRLRVQVETTPEYPDDMTADEGSKPKGET